MTTKNARKDLAKFYQEVHGINRRAACGEVDAMTAEERAALKAEMLAAKQAKKAAKAGAS